MLACQCSELWKHMQETFEQSQPLGSRQNVLESAQSILLHDINKQVLNSAHGPLFQHGNQEYTTELQNPRWFMVNDMGALATLSNEVYKK